MRLHGVRVRTDCISAMGIIYPPEWDSDLSREGVQVLLWNGRWCA